MKGPAVIRTLLGFLLFSLFVLGGCGDTAPEETSAGAGAAQPQGTKVRMTIGTQAFPEALVLGEVWQQALAANAYAVVLKKRIGPAGDLDQALQDRTIDGHVAYTLSLIHI